ncbi:MAG: beta-lactamase family protein, partial [Actinomycetota bacterium]|nr:beta-lactamase family protein [Actinomycetota bacterium]
MNEPIELAINQAAERLGRRNAGGVVAASTRASDEPVVTEAGQFIDGYAYPVEKVLFEVGSVTKVFTALLLADCVERGLVSLDTPLGELLPLNTSVPSRDRTEITLGHLATHTAGLPRSPLGRAAEFTRQDPYCKVDASALLSRLAGTSLRCTP